ncbi:MAG: tetratricopeptide repeat protein [bacterium]
MLIQDKTKDSIKKTYSSDTIIIPLLFIFAFIFTLNSISEPDTFWHLKMGQYIIDTHGFPFSDIFSYTLAGTRSYPVEWLFEVMWYCIYSVFGISGMILTKALISGFTSLFMYLTLRQYKTNNLLNYIIVACVFISAGFYFMDRPQIITYLGMALLIYITSLPDLEKRRSLWFIPFLILVWVNFHPGVVFGLIFLIFWVVEGYIDLFKHRIKPYAVSKRLLILILSICASLITPSTYHLYTFLFHHVVSFGSKGGLDYIAEFLPPSFSQTPAIFTGLVIFTVIFILGIFKIPIRFVLSGLVMLPMSFDMRRMVILGLISIAPGIGIIINEWIRHIRIHIPSFLLTILYSLIIIAPFGYEFYQYKTDYTDYKSIRIQEQFYPEQAIDFILKHHIKGNIYNSINFGGAVIFLGYPEIKDFIDTRLAPERILLPEVNQSLLNPHLFDKLLNKYNVSYALVETYVPFDYPELFPAPKWHLVYFDDYAQIYIKQGTGNDEIIDKYGYNVFNPSTFLYTFSPFQNPDIYFTQPGLFGDLQRLVKTVPYSAMANLAYGLALIYHNSDFKEGLKYIDNAKRIMPYNPRVLLWDGIEQGLHGDTKVMKKQFNLINTILKHQDYVTNEEIAQMNFIMGYYYYRVGLENEAAKSFRLAIKLEPKFSNVQLPMNKIEP